MKKKRKEKKSDNNYELNHMKKEKETRQQKRSHDNMLFSAGLPGSN